MKAALLKISGKLPSQLHILAASILLAFAFSHFAFLKIHDDSRDSINSVFPFFHNGTLYFCAGIFEMSTGLVCLLFPGRDLTNMVILGFVTVIVWYKLAFYFTGGTQCGCLGLLGRLLHVSEVKEKILPVIALVLLVATTSPWLFRIFQKVRRRASVSLLFLALSLLFTNQNASGEQTIYIRGEIDSAHYNPNTGKIYTNNQTHADFSVAISDQSWKICLTNQNDSIWWSELFWDGTNIYSFEPNGGFFYFHKPPIDDATLVTISPSPVYCSLELDEIGLSPLWLTYGFSPIAAITNENGDIELPLNWLGTRSSSQAYGYKWLIGSWIGGRFIDKIDVVRDHSLDLDNKQELLRYDMDYPENIITVNERNQSVKYRSEIEDGFIEASYQCTGWYQTNGISIPIASEFKWYLPPAPGRKVGKPTYLAVLKVTSIDISNSAMEPALDQHATSKSYVHDYRYKKVNETRIFKYAQYELHAGDLWRSANDPDLLKKSEEWLKHGRRYDDFGHGRAILSWLLLAALLIPPIALIWKKQKTKEKHEK